MGQRYAAERCAHGWPQVVSLARRRNPPDGARGGTPGQPPGGLLPPGQPRQLQTGDRAPPHAPSAKQAMAVPPLAGAVVEPAIGSRGARDPASRFGAAAAAVLCGCAGGGTGAASARIGCVLRRDAGGARRGRPTRAPPRMVVPGPPWIRGGCWRQKDATAGTRGADNRRQEKAVSVGSADAPLPSDRRWLLPCAGGVHRRAPRVTPSPPPPRKSAIWRVASTSPPSSAPPPHPQKTHSGT